MTLSHRLWTVLLAGFLAVAPLEGFAAKKSSSKGRPAAVQVKKNSTKAKKAVVAKRSTKTRQVAAKKAGKRVVVAQRRSVPVVAARPLPADPSQLALKASVAYVIDQESDQVLLGKNEEDVRPIASLTKLMTGMIVSDAGLPLDERITITGDDVDRLKFSSSRLKVGTELTRRQALHLTLMSSENRAAHALARTYPGGASAFVSAMNNKAKQLGMLHTQYVDSSGLSPKNRSSARDLAVLAQAAFEEPLLRKLSTSPGYQLATEKGSLRYVNSNGLVRAGEWDIGLQKTGFISEAGQCLVVQTTVKGRNLIMVFLDSASKVTRIKDAELVKRWFRQHQDVAGQGKGDAS